MGGRKLRIIIPALLSAFFINITVAYGAGSVIVALGASNTYGKGVGRDEAYPAQLEKLLGAKGYRATVLNKGINGNTTEQMLNRIQEDVPNGTRIVILQPGGNDFRKGYTSAETQKNISRITAMLRARKIILITMPNSMLKKMKQNPVNRGSDRQHLSPEGYRALAREIMPQVMRYLRRG